MFFRSLLLSISFYIFSCVSPDFKAENSNINPNINLEEVSSKEIQEDIQYLIRMLKNGYVGIRFQHPKKMDSATTALLALSSEGKEKSKVELCNAITKSLENLPDSHMYAAIQQEKGYAPCREEKKGQINVGKNLSSNKDRLWELLQKKTPKGLKIDVLAISSFGYLESERGQELVKTADILKTKPFFIIDLRGNGGGPDTALQKWLSKLISKNKKLTSEYWTLQSPEALEIRINWAKLQASWVSEQSVAKRFNNNVRDWTLEKKKAEVNQIPKWEETKKEGLIGEGKKDYQGTIFVLTDRGTASTSESAVAHLTQLFNAMKIGTNTLGCWHFGNVGLAILPNTKILVQMGVRYFESPYGFIEKSGISPNISVSDGVDALDIALTEVDKRF